MKKKSIVLILLLSLLTGCAKNQPSQQMTESTAEVNAPVAETEVLAETTSQTEIPDKISEEITAETNFVESETEDPENLPPPTLSPEMLQGLQDDTEENWEYIPHVRETPNDDGTIQFEFENFCTLTFPKNWAGQFKVDSGEEKYSYIVSATNSDDADLFYISEITAENMTGNERGILGTWAGGLVVLTCPEVTPETEEYTNLSKDIGDIIQSAECATSEGFKPVDTELEGNFVAPSALDIQASELIRGTWAVNTSMWTQPSITQMQFSQNSAYMIFTAEGVCAYRFFPEQEEGYYLLNTSITSTDSYTEKPYALCYFNGQLHRVLIYQMAMQIEGMPNISKSAGSIDGGEYISNVWDFYQYSESQSLAMDSMLDN